MEWEHLHTAVIKYDPSYPPTLEPFADLSLRFLPTDHVLESRTTAPILLPLPIFTQLNKMPSSKIALDSISTFLTLPYLTFLPSASSSFYIFRNLVQFHLIIFTLDRLDH